MTLVFGLGCSVWNIIIKKIYLNDEFSDTAMLDQLIGDIFAKIISGKIEFGMQKGFQNYKSICYFYDEITKS